jgi:hypothetical protein
MYSLAQSAALNTQAIAARARGIPEKLRRHLQSGVAPPAAPGESLITDVS